MFIGIRKEKIKMRKSIILVVLILISNLLYSQESRFSIGVRSNFGIHGIDPPFRWETKKEALSRIDIGIIKPKINFSSAILFRYSLVESIKMNLNLTLEFGYDFSTLRKEWHFRSGYDEEFFTYSDEVRIIHELKSHHLIAPVKINFEFGKFIYSMGLIGSRVLSASVDRTKRSRGNVGSSTWIDEEVIWKANTKESEIREYNSPYLTNYTGLEGTIGIGYYLSDKIIIGMDLNRNFSNRFIKVYVNSDDPSEFYYESDKATIKLILML